MKAPSRSLRSAILGALAVALCFHAAISAEDKPAPEVPKKTLTANEESQLDEVNMGFEKAYDLLRAKRGDEAIKQFRDALPSLEKLVGPEDSRMLKRRVGLADMLNRQRMFDEAVDEYRAVLAIRNRLLGPADVEAMWLHDALASMLEATGKLSEAEQELRTVIPQMERVIGPAKEEMMRRRLRLVSMLDTQGKRDEVEKEYRAIVDIAKRGLGLNDQQTYYFWGYLIRELYRFRNYHVALAEYQKALMSQKEATGEQNSIIDNIALDLIGSLEADRHLKAALAVVKEREKASEKISGPQHPFTENLRNRRKRIEAELKQQQRPGK